MLQKECNMHLQPLPVDVCQDDSWGETAVKEFQGSLLMQPGGAFVTGLHKVMDLKCAAMAAPLITALTAVLSVPQVKEVGCGQFPTHCDLPAPSF